MPPAAGFWNAPAGQAIKDVWDAIKSLDARLAASTGLQANVPGTFPQTPASAPVPTARPEVPTSIFQQFLDGMQKMAPQGDPLPTLEAIRDQVSRAPSGVHEVREINPTPVHAPINVTVYATTNADPNAIAQQVGERVQSALSGHYSDGAYA